MSRTSRIVAGAILAAIAGAALAAPAEADSTSVSFSGSSPLGLAVLACASHPNKGSISITTDDTVNVENVTGHTAYVYINGSKTAHQVGNNQGVPITFPVGEWSVALAPTCLLNLSDADTVSVNVAKPAAVLAPATTPTPTKTVAPEPTHTAAPHRTPTHSPTVQPRSAATPTPTPTTPATTPAASALASAPGSVAGTTAAGSAGGGGGSAGSSTHTSLGAKSSDSGTVADGTTGQDVNIGVAQALPASDSQPASPSYLLAVIALISILGVGSAIVRALNNQRQARKAAY